MPRRPPELDDLTQIVSEVIERHRDAREISPTWIATETMVDRLKAKALQKSHSRVYQGCHLQLRQIARGLLRQFFEDGDAPQAQHEMFSGLQAMYPRANHSLEDPVYCRLEDMTEADVRYNVARLRAEAEAKQKHADALEGWWEDQRRKRRRA